jgi:squalene cyclase
MTWKAVLKSDPTPWLLEPEPPSVRYRALRDLLDRPADDADVLAAQAAIATWPPVAELLAAQKRDGYWVKRDYYLPKTTGTFWVLTVLADLGLTNEHEQIRRACEFMFGFQREHGGFCRRRRVSGRGLVWDARPGPCTHARIVRFLIQFGYGDDPRLRAAVGWLLTNQRDDGMWDCGSPKRPGCLRATLDVLRVAAMDPETAAHPATAAGAAAVLDLLMEPRMARYHVGVEWTTLEYPYFNCSVISALEALARLGHPRDHPKIRGALDYLLSRQLPGGGWPLDERPRQPPIDVGSTGEANKWLTLDALRVVKLLGAQKPGFR